MSSLLVVLVISMTSAGAVALGIFAAYFSINGILFAFGRQSKQAASTVSTPLLIPSQTHASGD